MNVVDYIGFTESQQAVSHTSLAAVTDKVRTNPKWIVQGKIITAIYSKALTILCLITMTPNNIGDAPELKELLLLECSDGKELRIIDRVTHIWKNIAITLGFSRVRIKGIEMSCHYQPKDATLEMFKQWLKGAHSQLKPATWSTLIQSLKDVKLTQIADMLCNLVSWIVAIKYIFLLNYLCLHSGSN